MRLIDADALAVDIKECIEAKYDNCEYEQVQGLETALERIDEQLTAESERKTGKWREPAITPEAFEALQMAIESLEHIRDCVLKQFGECSYAETGCSDCKVKRRISEALKASEKPNSLEPPEIVRCGDCAWYGLRHFCHNYDCYGFDNDDFCSQGVKRRLEHD